MKNQEKQAIEVLEKYNQHHIVEHIKKLDEDKKIEILEQIKEIDFQEATDLYKRTQQDREKRNAKIEPLQTINTDQIDPEQKNEYIKAGEKILKENKFAVVTMAGGQGTRLRA